MNSIAQKYSATTAQIALAWNLAQKFWIGPIPGTTKIHRLEENVGSADLSLSVSDLKEINDAIAKIEVHGARYTEPLP